jgi:hypothetical protein
MSWPSVLGDLELLQEEPETRHHESESHQGQTRANPSKKGPLSSQVIAETSLLPCPCRPIHIRCFLLISHVALVALLSVAGMHSEPRRRYRFVPTG